MIGRALRAARALALFAGALSLAACGGAKPIVAAPAAIDTARSGAASSKDGEVLGRWLFAELVAPGGDLARAREARKRLDAVAHDGMWASIARAIDDGAHGRFALAADAYLAAAKAARSSSDPDAPLVAWFATNHLLGLRTSAEGLWAKAKPVVLDLLDHPGNLGWRARSELVDWWTQEAWEAAETDVQDLSADRYGCVRAVRLAGPFGHGAPSDRRRAFDAERPGPWPRRFAPDPGVAVAPRVLETERHGCQVEAAEPAGEGIYYAETFVELPAEREVIVAVQGALAVLVDDRPVLERDTREWGVWPKFGVRLRLAAGRHRILARIPDTETSVRLLAADGSPLGVASSDDPRPTYGLVPPVVLADPNVLSRFVSNGRPVEISDHAARYLGAFLAHVESQDDLASVLFEPLVRDAAKATGPALAMAAIFAEKDPIFPDSDGHDLVKELRTQASAKDEDLWWPRFWLALDEADKKGLPDAALEVKKLTQRFHEVPQVLQGLASLYGRLDWKAERARTLRELAERFPNDRAILEQVLGLYEEEGRHADADRVASRIKQLHPDSEVDVDRALARRDYRSAVAELERLGKRRPDRKDIADRIADVMQRAGNDKSAWDRLERALAKNPLDASARLAFADAKFASGDHQALRKALADAILRGADASDLAGAVELVEGMTELEPFRIDGRRVVAEYEASKTEMDGTAARVLDYAVVWVHPDGSSRMLEHELIRVQSQEAIGQVAEQRVPQGLTLRMRVLKKNGQVLEPEFVAGKPTLTMPHLEVGDYIETEAVTSSAGDGQRGRRWVGPHWFFREADVAYWRSEFVVVAPKDRPLSIETRGEVPAPKVTERDAVVVRRWRVDKSPAAPQEPGSAPIQEFLPSVRVGWGVSLDDQLRRLVDAASDELPRDPRLERIARGIVAGASASSAAGQVAFAATDDEERARRLYRWVLSNVEEGREGDGRRAVIGKSGNRMSAFLYLCRVLGIPVELAAVRDRLSPEPTGPFTEAESFDDFVLRVGTKPVWMTVRDKFAPFGYLPASLRGQPAYRLVPGTPKETTSAEGSNDGVVYEGTGELHADGSATLEVAESFVGKLAIGLRGSLEQMPEAQLQAAIESRLLARALPGARLVKMSIEHAQDLDQPLVLRMQVEVPELARRRGRELVLAPPFAVRVTQLTTLPRRQTPLLIGDPTWAKVRLALSLPKGAKVVSELRPVEVKDDDRVVRVGDAASGGQLVLDRFVDIPAGRVQPDAYSEFQGFAQRSDDALLREITIETP